MTTPSAKNATTGGRKSNSLSHGLRGASKLTTEVGHLLGAPSAACKTSNKGSRYRMKDEIGRGGFGVVRGAVDSETGSQVVVKQVCPLHACIGAWGKRPHNMPSRHRCHWSQ